MIENPNCYGSLPQDWLEEWKDQAPVELPPEWDDPEDLYPPIPRKPEITEKNAQTVEKALYPIRSNKKSETV